VFYSKTIKKKLFGPIKAIIPNKFSYDLVESWDNIWLLVK
jgi:hypothetical protein